MITTRMGLECRIVADCGWHKPKYFPVPAHLVEIVALEDISWHRFYWAAFLKAEGGLAEINQVVDAAPKVRLSRAQLDRAYREAE